MKGRPVTVGTPSSYYFEQFTCIFRSSFGAAMCHVSSDAMMGSHFTRHSGRRHKIYEASKYLGMALFSYTIDAAISKYGWLHGLQMTTLLVGLNFLFGLAYIIIMRKIERVPQKDESEKTMMFLKLLNSRVLRDRLLFYYFGVEVLLNTAIRAPLILIVSIVQGTMLT